MSRFQVERLPKDSCLAGGISFTVTDAEGGHPYRREVCYASYSDAVSIARCLNLINSAENKLCRQTITRGR